MHAQAEVNENAEGSVEQLQAENNRLRRELETMQAGAMSQTGSMQSTVFSP